MATSYEHGPHVTHQGHPQDLNYCEGRYMIRIINMDTS